MMRYHVEITDSAMQDITEIYDYISKELQSYNSARKQYERIVKNILMLEYLPYRYPVMSDSTGNATDLRLMPIDNYSAIYVCRGGTVIVTAVLYSASDIRQRMNKLRVIKETP